MEDKKKELNEALEEFLRALKDLPDDVVEQMVRNIDEMNNPKNN